MLLATPAPPSQYLPSHGGPLGISAMPARHPLQSPVTAAFAGHWQTFAEHHGTARCLPKDIGAFASLGGTAPQDTDDFVRLVKRRHAPVILLQTDEIAIPKALEQVHRTEGVQMVLQVPIGEVPEYDVIELSAVDAPEMLELARLTKPGPFEINTRRLGRFIGIREGGVLAAMAGQRMAFPGWTEISGVSVHPDHRGQGLARLLVRLMVAQIESEGAKPFLHTYINNEPAIALYESLGFAIRAKVNIAVVA
ncbi:MAG: GNAT family N-acetyltransferase [Pseudomonadota bacterium]